ncbi:hypothetical protein BDN70DRAFT_20651 [Pholiota conissans]|uniref:Uncharacterized protein n=1 Tax=Pholiota conissans TaxID=109636 RepID=A0A9P5ZFL4_9AGAR|nr:hypothetical protein BDN70DRAFT_20651 [Pholiota conissans]
MDQQSPKNRTYLQSWLAIPARTRLVISLGVCVVAATGIMVSDFLEQSVVAAQKEQATPHNDTTTSELS